MSKETLNDNLGDNLAIYDDLQTQTNDSFDLEARLLSSDGISSSLPSMSFAAKATYSRDGNDLVLTLEGESVVVKNYFASPNPPALTTMDGAVLTPQMIASFLQNGDTQDFYAASLLKSLLGDNKSLDNSAIAVVENLEGSVLVIRNGEAKALQDGDQLYQGDEISTASASSASMIFADGTQFKIGGEARISLDQFSYESSTSQGLQVLSILSGAFSYVSGLVAKGDPANVQLRTPIGEIGIRGTKIVGEVDAERAEASITLLEGRILYTTPQGEEHEISQGFDTLTIKNGGDKVKESTISAEKAARSYDVFENAGEVTNFLQQEPTTQQDQGADASVGTDAPLPDISYSQAQADLIALIVSDAEKSLEGSAELDQIISLGLQRAEKLLEKFGIDQTDDKSLLANNIFVGANYNEAEARGDSNYFIDLAPLNNKVWATFTGQTIAAGNTINLKLQEDLVSTISIKYYRGGYEAPGSQAGSKSAFYYDHDGNSGTPIQKFEWSQTDQVAGSIAESIYDSPPPGAGTDDLMMEIYFNSNEVFRIVFDKFYPITYDKGNSSHVQQLPSYTIFINGDDTTPDAAGPILDQVKDLGAI